MTSTCSPVRRQGRSRRRRSRRAAGLRRTARPSITTTCSRSRKPRGDPFSFRHVVIEPGVSPRPLGLPGDANTLAYDGDLIAYNNGDTNVTVHNWRTGADRAVILPDSPDWLDVRADGSLVVSTHSGIYTAAPDGPPVLLSRTGERAQFAGERIVYASSTFPAGRVRRLYAVDAGGSPRKIGVPTAWLAASSPTPTAC